MYKKRYNLLEVQKVINTLIKEDKKFIDLENLLIEIGFDTLDIHEFFIKNIKHRIRYDRDDYRDR
jgi:hypothetical protein